MYKPISASIALTINENRYKNLKLCQAAKYNNADGTITLGITGYYEDMQCSNHPTFFYEISKSGDGFTRIDNATVMPSLELSEFFAGSKSIEILKTYFPDIKKTYLGSDATFEDLINEVYDFHIILPAKGNKVKVTLTICDYIPTNELSIDKEDWNEIKDNIRTIEFAYDRRLKRFISKRNKRH